MSEYLNAYIPARAVPLLEFMAIVLVAALGYFAARRILLRGIARLIRQSRSELDDLLLETAVFRRLALLVPALVFYFAAGELPGSAPLVHQVAGAFMLAFGVLAFGSLLTALQKVYSRLYEDRFPIKGYVQIAKIVLYALGGLIAISTLVGKSPWALLTGIGAMTAVVILVFRDTILSLVASIQISTNNLLKVGDWIEAPAFGADGDVVDISLHTIRVQNWDKTITTIPTYKLLESSFKNWQGMRASGGRRIKRALYIDLNTICFCDEEMLERFARFELIREYIEARRAEVRRYNAEHGLDTSQRVNGRRLTNVGTFRAYMVSYLRRHPRIRRDMTFLVRQLQAGERGLPIEIYVFTDDTDWIHYEKLQADLFDHLLAVVPEFGLRLFQSPSGHDLRSLSLQRS